MLPLSAWTIPSQPLVETESPPGMLNAVIVVVALINHRDQNGQHSLSVSCVRPLFNLGRGDPHIKILKVCFLDYIPDYPLNKMEKMKP